MCSVGVNGLKEFTDREVRKYSDMDKHIVDVIAVVV